MLTYLELVYNGSYVGKEPDMLCGHTEIWRYNGEVFLARPQTDLIVGPIAGTFLFM